MANEEGFLGRKNKYFTFLFSVICYTTSFCSGSLVANSLSFNNIVQFDANGQAFFSDESNVVDVHRLHRRDVSEDDPTCKAYAQQVAQLKSKIDEVHTFTNETRRKMAIAWAGTNDGNIIILTTGGDPHNPSSAVFKSTDYGVTYKNLTKDLNITGLIKSQGALNRNPHDSKKVYLLGVDKFMYITEDGGDSFNRITLPFIIVDEIIYHSSPDYSNYLLAHDPSQFLYVSKDNGRHWKKVHDSAVDKAFWGVIPAKNDGPDEHKMVDTADTIYISYGQQVIKDPILQHFFGFMDKNVYTLAKSTDGGETFTDILSNVVSFERQGKFLYASQVKNNVNQNGWRQLMISTDYGRTFLEAQLPTIEPDRFYSVMDIEDNMIFMHVDNKDDSGHGTLYTSANQGIIYSESLPRHLYPNYGEIHDFYKVQSLRGVYITSQIKEDDSIHSVITYNRGAEWHDIPAPEGVPCKDENKPCFLQIHGLYSMKRGIMASTPLSEKTAIGLILVHGHVADALQKTPPDVFISRDGGYSWNFALKGPHHYMIGDHGGFLAAVTQSEPNPKVIKFSLDEGRCWQEYQFTDKVLNITGLITEPDGKSSVAMIWGYIPATKKWEVHVLDFKKILNRKCGDSDYESWKAHAEHRKIEGADISGCLLGLKETFERLKKDSWCYNGYDHIAKNSTKPCTCTREDYECDYAYFRPGNSDECRKDPDFNQPEVDICLHGHDEKLVSLGYRKIPGDQCVDGYHPSSKLVDLNKVCDEFGKLIVEIDEGKGIAKKQEGGPNVGEKAFRSGIQILAIIIASLVFILIAVMGVYFARKFILLRRHKTEYRYSMLSQGEQHNLIGDDDDGDEGNLERDLDRAFDAAKYHDSDEELNTTTRPSSARQNGSAKKSPKRKESNPFKTPHDDTNPFGGYHDDSDDDMLS